MQPKRSTTVEEYLAADEASEVKLEFVGGEILAMTGARMRHNLVASNLVFRLRLALTGRPSFVLTSDQRLEVAETGAFVYPDVQVVCGALDVREPDDPRTLRNPIFLAEVLSPSTAAYDLGTKTAHYRRLASLRAFLTIDPVARAVQRHERQEDGRWVVSDPAEAIPLDCLGVTLDPGELFEGLDALDAMAGDAS